MIDDTAFLLSMASACAVIAVGFAVMGRKTGDPFGYFCAVLFAFLGIIMLIPWAPGS